VVEEEDGGEGEESIVSGLDRKRGWIEFEDGDNVKSESKKRRGNELLLLSRSHLHFLRAGRLREFGVKRLVGHSMRRNVSDNAMFRKLPRPDGENIPPAASLLSADLRRG